MNVVEIQKLGCNRQWDETAARGSPPSACDPSRVYELAPF
jgi:hypothetical protein